MKEKTNKINLLNNETISLNKKERDILIDLIDNPTEPNEKVRQLLKSKKPQ